VKDQPESESAQSRRGLVACSARVHVDFVSRDVWIGLSWKREVQMFPKFCRVTTWCLCLIPCFPIVWSTESEIAQNDRTH